MSGSGNWKASTLEQRIAWGMAASCIMLVLLASARPEWFDFSTSQQKQATKQTARQALSTPTKHAATQQRKIHLKARIIPPATAAKKLPAVHAKTKSPPPVKKPIAITDGFYVQLGAFHESARAQGLADQLKRNGWTTVIASKPNGLHAVWVGPKKTRSEAEKLRKAIHLKLKNKGFIVHKKQV